MWDANETYTPLETDEEAERGSHFLPQTDIAPLPATSLVTESIQWASCAAGRYIL